MDDVGEQTLRDPRSEPEAAALIAQLRQAFEYYRPALAFPRSCWLDPAGSSSATISTTPEVPPPPAGTRLGDFEIVEELGRGGMGVVYRARQLSLGRDVALKILPSFARYGRLAVQRFRTEARAASRLHHTNIVAVYAQGEHEGQYYYAMELIDGVSLDVALGNGTSLLSGVRADYRRLAALLAEVASALEYAHQQGVVHRDVKPHNLLLGRDGHLYLTDFGLAYLAAEPHVTAAGEVLGTPAYLSPEQIRGTPSEIDQRTDVYALGVTLYELVTGGRPFRGATREQVIANVCSTEPVAPRRLVPQMPIDLETICLRAMAKSPLRRYPSAGALAEDLRRFAEGRRIIARRPGLATRAVRWVRRHRTATLLGVGIALLGFLTLGWVGSAQLARHSEAQRLVQRAYEQLAYADYHQAEFVEADIEQAAALGADPQALHLVRALTCMSRQDEPGAIAHLTAYLAEAPADQRAGYMLAWAYRSGDQAAQAAEILARTEARGPPTSAEAWFFRGLAMHFSDPAAASESYREATVLRAQSHGFYPQAVLHLARARNQQLYATRSLEAFPDAVASLQQLIEHGSYGSYPYYLLSIAHRLAAEVYSGSTGTRDDSLVAQHYGEALGWARRGQALEPAADRPIAAEAECLESMGRLAEAAAARTRALAVATKDRSRWEHYHYRWRLNYWLGDFAQALDDLRACARYEPNSRCYAHVYPALVLAAEGDLAAASAHARALAEEHPASAQDTLWAAACLRLLGQSEAAQQLLNERTTAALDFAAGLVPPQTEDWARALLAYARDGGPLEPLEAMAGQVSAPWRLWGELYFQVAVRQLAAGDQAGARSDLRRAYRSFDSETRYTYHARLILVALEANPTWPVQTAQDEKEATDVEY